MPSLNRDWLPLLYSFAVGLALGLALAWPRRSPPIPPAPDIPRLSVRTVLLLPDSGAWVRLVPDPGRFHVDSSGLRR